MFVPCIARCALHVQVLLSSVEVAMEYLMGLTTSPYVEWLQVRARTSGILAGQPLASTHSQQTQDSACMHACVLRWCTIT